MTTYTTNRVACTKCKGTGFVWSGEHEITCPACDGRTTELVRGSFMEWLTTVEYTEHDLPVDLEKWEG